MLSARPHIDPFAGDRPRVVRRAELGEHRRRGLALQAVQLRLQHRKRRAAAGRRKQSRRRHNQGLASHRVPRSAARRISTMISEASHPPVCGPRVPPTELRAIASSAPSGGNLRVRQGQALGRFPATSARAARKASCGVLARGGASAKRLAEPGRFGAGAAANEVLAGIGGGDHPRAGVGRRRSLALPRISPPRRRAGSVAAPVPVLGSPLRRSRRWLM